MHSGCKVPCRQHVSLSPFVDILTSILLVSTASVCTQDTESHSSSPAQTVTSLSAGETLRLGSTLASADGQSKLVFQGDGNLVVRPHPVHPSLSIRPVDSRTPYPEFLPKCIQD